MPNFPNPAYPVGGRKNCSVALLLKENCPAEPPVLAGRLVRWELLLNKTFAGTLQDDSGILAFETDKKTDFQTEQSSLRPGDIVEIVFDRRDGKFVAQSLRRLVPTHVDWHTLHPKTVNWKRAIISKEQKSLLEKRSNLIQRIRSFFLERGFLEIDAPTLVHYPGQEPHLEPFQTWHGSVRREATPLYLQTSPEFSMKKLLASGFEKIFYLGHSFRNEPVSNLHQPEFLMLEWYRAYANYTDIMADCEELLRFLVEFLYSKQSISFGSESLDFSKPFHRLTVVQALKEFSQIDYESIREPADFARAARRKGYRTVGNSWAWDDIFFKIFLNEIEPKLGNPIPTFLTEYPISMGALAHRIETKPDFVERFELYVSGIELANAFTELNDPEEQVARFLEDQSVRKKTGKESFPIDPDFVEALRIGMPPAAGIALGVDRLLMILLDQPSIESVIYFPEM